MIVFGAGMAGLMAANLLRRHQPLVLEAQPSLPSNHGALLRFRSPVVGDTLGQPFDRVYVQKGIVYGGHQVGPSLRLHNLYSLKVTGEARERSIMNLEPSERWIAPEDFCEVMARDVDIKFGERVTAESLPELIVGGPPVVSTIPMPIMMDITRWDSPPEFRWTPIWSLRVKLERTKVYQTLYYPGPEPWYRASITGDLLLIEYLHDPAQQAQGWRADVDTVLDNFGLVVPTGKGTVVFQPYGKLLPIPEAERRTFILALTDWMGIYSLGRFGTWRQILLDDLVKDLRTIDRYITQRDSYGRRLNWRI